MIQINDILMGRAKFDELPVELKQNIKRLLNALHELELSCPLLLKITSGYRSAAINAAAGGAKQSAHTQCLAVDFADKDCKLWAWCLQNLEQLAKLGLYLEDKRWTPTWVHMQIRKPSSGHRIFVPNTNPPLDASIWDGKYNSKYNS